MDISFLISNGPPRYIKVKAADVVRVELNCFFGKKFGNVLKIRPPGWVVRPTFLHEITKSSRPLRIDGRTIALANDELVVHLAGIGDEWRLVREEVPEEHTIGVHIS
jgi:hypothetical protein